MCLVRREVCKLVDGGGLPPHVRGQHKGTWTYRSRVRGHKTTRKRAGLLQGSGRVQQGTGQGPGGDNDAKLQELKLARNQGSVLNHALSFSGQPDLSQGRLLYVWLGIIRYEVALTCLFGAPVTDYPALCAHAGRLVLCLADSGPGAGRSGARTAAALRHAGVFLARRDVALEFGQPFRDRAKPWHFLRIMPSLPGIQKQTRPQRPSLSTHLRCIATHGSCVLTMAPCLPHVKRLKPPCAAQPRGRGYSSAVENILTSSCKLLLALLPGPTSAATMPARGQVARSPIC